MLSDWCCGACADIKHSSDLVGARSDNLGTVLSDALAISRKP